MLVTKFWSWWHLRYVTNIDWTFFVGHFLTMSRQYLNCGLQLVKISGRRLLLNYSEWLQNGDPKIVTWQTRVPNRHYCNVSKNGSILNGLEFQSSGLSSGTVKNWIIQIRLSNCAFNVTVLFDFFDIDKHVFIKESDG